MKLIGLDFETYYNDDGYSLKKLSTADYIYDPRFRALGVSIKVDNKPAVYTSYVKEALTHYKSTLEASAILAHHAHFDGLILAHHFGIRPRFWFDTLSMARARGLALVVGGSLEALMLHFGLGKKAPLSPDSTPEELRERATTDIEATFEIFKRLYSDFPTAELKLIDWTVRCFTEPKLCLDEMKAATLVEMLKNRKQALLDELGVDATMLRSDQQFAELLRSLGVEPPTKMNPKGQPIFAFAKTDAAMTEMAECGDEEIETLVAARLELKSSGDQSRAERLLAAWRGNGRAGLPVYLGYSAAHTHRWGGGDKTNWQNFSKVRRDARNQIVAGTGEIRGAVIAPPGHSLVVGDASQIEARLTFWLAGEAGAVEAFRTGRDLYSELAGDIFGKPIDRKLKNSEGEYLYYVEGFCGKTATLGCGFGMGPPKFKDTVRRVGKIEIELATARKSVYTYRDRYARVPKLWERAEHLLANPGTRLGPVLSHGDRIELPNGLFLYYPELRKGGNNEWSVMTRRGRRKTWGGAITENIVQSLARIIIAYQLLILREKFHVATMSHDELVTVVPDEQADYAREYMQRVMCMGPPGWVYECEGCAGELPLASEVGVSKIYRDAKG